MKYDVWFCRHDGDLYSVVSKPNEPPAVAPRKVGSVHNVLSTLKKKGHEVAQVGILDPEMIGLDVEV